MSSQIREVVSKCAGCNLLNAQRNLAHKHFRAKLFCTPRTTYAMDFHGLFKTKSGYDNVLGIIDLATKYLILICLLYTSPSPRD